MNNKLILCVPTGYDYWRKIVKNLLLASILVLVCQAALFGQQKYALVIGNAKYSGISSLNNTTNDANDMEAALKRLGFTVDKVLDGDLDKMETAIERFCRRLGADKNTYGFFYYAGHGVQSENGGNYLIPVSADGIKTESHLHIMAVSLQATLNEMEKAGNELNMIVLDACRDNPFGWKRGGSSRGLSIVSRNPASSYMMYATSANSTADDNPNGRNGLFTSHLLNNLNAPGLSVHNVFDNTMGDVAKASDNKQRLELRTSYSGGDRVYLGTRPIPKPTPVPTPVPVSPSAGMSAKEQLDQGNNYHYGWNGVKKDLKEAAK